MSCILDVWTIDTIISQSLFTKMFRACVVKLAFLTQVHGFIVVYILFEVAEFRIITGTFAYKVVCVAVLFLSLAMRLVYSY